jgi:hypothetical protein
MNEQRMQILQMLSEGKVTADEAEQLIAAVEREPGDVATSGVELGKKAKPKFIRVLVNSPDNFGGDGPGRVNVRVPIQLLRAGVRLASLIPPQAYNHVNEELRKSGVPIDLSQLKPEHIEELIEQLGGITVDVDQPDAKVQVFCE